MDARLLDNLTKRELEKHLGVTRKAHQSSIVHGITFLRMIKYDRQAINERRRQCEFSDCDPLVWTNQRFINWVRAIDLNEYAENLKGIPSFIYCVYVLKLLYIPVNRNRDTRRCRCIRPCIHCRRYGNGPGDPQFKKYYSSSLD